MEKRSINSPYEIWNGSGNYFQLFTVYHQPIWCSYSLQQLKSALDSCVSGFIVDSNNKLLFSK